MTTAFGERKGVRYLTSGLKVNTDRYSTETNGSGGRMIGEYPLHRFGFRFTICQDGDAFMETPFPITLEIWLCFASFCIEKASPLFMDINQVLLWRVNPFYKHEQ